METRTWQETLAAAPKGSAALVLSDPPYNTTNNDWEAEIDTCAFFAYAWQALRPNGAIVLTTAEPFTGKVIQAAGKNFKYCWYWDKKLPTGHLNSKRQPLRQIEPVVVSYRKQATYHPQMTDDPRGNRKWKRRNTKTGSYNPYGSTTYESSGKKHPTTLLSVYQAPKGKVHPTEKPVDLMEYLIKTYAPRAGTRPTKPALV